MGYTENLLDDIRRAIDARPGPLQAARDRLAASRTAAEGFHGALRTYRSGSIPQHTVVDPVSDADGGVVLNRVCYPRLGPDGDGEPPDDVVDELRDHVGRRLRARPEHAEQSIRVTTSRRGPKVHFGDPVDEQDPTVDMVLALTRRGGPGLWIPDLDHGTWEASNPECHVQLFGTGSTALVRTRRRVVRLAKGWNKAFSTPGFSSHQLSVWAWEFVAPGHNQATGLLAVLDSAATRLETRQPTRDPADVSPNIKSLITTATAATRLRRAADTLDESLQHDHDLDVVTEALDTLFPDKLTGPAVDRARWRRTDLITGSGLSTTSLGLAGPAAALPATRAYGHHRPR